MISSHCCMRTVSRTILTEVTADAVDKYMYQGHVGSISEYPLESLYWLTR